jgi:hypothetical protein
MAVAEMWNVFLRMRKGPGVRLERDVYEDASIGGWAEFRGTKRMRASKSIKS